jgi:hypothetical protein
MRIYTMMSQVSSQAIHQVLVIRWVYSDRLLVDPATCFNGYTAERVAGNCPEETDHRDEHRDVEACFDYRCCHPGHTLTETMRAANAAVHDYDDG